MTVEKIFKEGLEEVKEMKAYEKNEELSALNITLNHPCEICGKIFYIYEGTVFPDGRCLHFKCYRDEVYKFAINDAKRIISQVIDEQLGKLNEYDEDLDSEVEELDKLKKAINARVIKWW